MAQIFADEKANEKSTGLKTRIIVTKPTHPSGMVKWEKELVGQSVGHST